MNIILFIIAFLEGFTTLSVEIMSIRNSITIIWSNAIATSIILWIILLALSYGYYRWWLYASKKNKHEIRVKIFINLLIASILYTWVSFPFENSLLTYLLGLDIWYFFPISIGISILFVVPVFLASQTIPLLSELIDDDKKAVVIGKLLFFSTIGSFVGSVMTSLVFFSTIGVEKSIVVNWLILACLAGIIYLTFDSKIRTWWRTGLILLYIACFLWLLSLDYLSLLRAKDTIYQFSSEYNDIVIKESWDIRLFLMNGSHSSWLVTGTKRSYFGYIKKVTDIIDLERPKRILVIWAAGFSLPQDIAKREYVEQVDVCDIDGSLDTIAEQYFLKEELNPKIVFYKQSARFFLNEKIRNKEKYDFIFLDAYNGKISIPSELLTQDFFQNVHKLSSGTIAMNLILDTKLDSLFYKKLTNTLRESLGETYISRVTEDATSYYGNYIALNRDEERFNLMVADEVSWLYTDNRNSLEFDKYTLFYREKMN